MSISISLGAGTASIASEKVGVNDYQQIKVVDGTTASTNKWVVNSDGSAQVSVVGTITTTASGTGSIIAVLQSSSVIAVATGSVVTIPTGNQSVSGTVGASVIGWAPVQFANASIITRWADSSVIAIVTGSVTALTAGNQSVSGTVGASIVGQLPAGTAPLGSVATLQGTNPWVIVGSVYGSGSVVSFQGGTIIASLVNTVPSSVIVGASIFGQLPAGTAPLGSVATLQGTNPWVTINVGSIITIQTGSVITVAQNSSILAVPVGSVITVWKDSSVLSVPVGSTIALLQSPSIVGTYAEDAASASADKGVFVLGVRNDTLSSVSSADGDYTQYTVGPMGEMITANSPITKWIYGTTSIVSGASVALIAAQGASVFSYLTGLNIVNPSANNLTGNLSTGAGAASVLVYWVAPANGGSNMVFPNPLRSRDNTAILASISGVGSVYLSAQGFIAKT